MRMFTAKNRKMLVACAIVLTLVGTAVSSWVVRRATAAPAVSSTPVSPASATTGKYVSALDRFNSRTLSSMAVEPRPFTFGVCDTAGPIEVEGSVLGTTPTAYPTLTAGFAAINAGTHTGAITIDVCGNTDETTGTALLSASGSGSASYTSIMMSPAGGAARTITGATTAGSPMIDLSGADNLTIDGLNTGGNSLTIANTTVSATTVTSTIRFIGGATGNTITNCNVQGSVSSSVATNGAVIFFSTDAVTANGNDNNTISNNNIGPAGANLPTKGILCNGSTSTTAIGNSGLIINNNNIFDYFGAAVSSAGLAVNGGCNTFSITNNRFYQTATRTWTTGAEHNGILLNSATATSGVQGMTITGNIVGYASNTQTGVYTLTGSTGIFRGIRHNGISTGTTSNINNNTVAAVSLTGVTSSGTSTSTPFVGIIFNEGNIVSNGNTVGSQSATGSLTYSTTTTTATDVYGIYNFTSNAWTSNNNNVGGIAVTNAGASGTFIIYGMRAFTASTTPWNASSNNVGGTVANSISLNATGAASQVIGMFTSNCPLVLTSNTVRNLTSNIGTGSTTGASVVGIMQTSATPNSTLSQNTIFNLSNTNATAASVVTGIQFTGATANLVERNIIHSLTVATNSGTAEVNGIRTAAGTTTYQNNVIALGAGIPNAIGGATSSGLNGINEVLGTNSFYHNSIYVGGSPTAGTGSSWAFNSTQVTVTRNVRDNIFFNARSNSGATGKNYAVRVAGTAPNPAGLTINNNVYFTNGAGAVFGFFNSLDVADLATWKTAVGQDGTSFFSNPQFNDPTNAVPDLHLHPTNATVAEGNGFDVGVTNDFDGQTRAGLTPTDIGADAGNFNGVDLSPPSITYVPLGNTSITTNRLQVVTITDVTGVATGGLAPRIYFNKNAGANFSTQCSLVSGTVQNGNWNCTIDNALVGGVVATDVIRYFVVAQDTLGNLAANPSGGFTGTDVNNVTTPPTTPSLYTIVTALTGSFNVGTGETYTSLTNTGGIFEALNAGAFTGNVTINITTDLTTELGTVALNQWSEDGVGNYTLTIKPSGGPRTITGTNTGALIRFNGTDRVTLDGSTTGATATGVGGNAAFRELTIQNTNVGTGAAVVAFFSGVSGAQNDTVRNVNILGQDPTTSLIGIAFGGNTLGTVGTDNDNNRIENCSIKRSLYGIYSAGASSANPNQGTVITMNETSAVAGDRIRRVGMFIVNDNGGLFTQNSLSGISTNESADGIGIALGTQGIDTTTATSGGITNALVARNKIDGVASLSTTGFSAAGITVAGGPGGANTIANNMVTGVTAPSTSPDITSGIYVMGVAGSVTRIYHNSVSLTGDRGAVASQTPSFGLAVTGSDPTLELKNNIFYTTQIASGGGVNAKSFAIGMVTTTFANLDSNFNDFWSTGANDGGFRSGSLTTAAGLDYVDIAAWRTAVSDDLNSLEADPTYTDPLTNLHLLAGSPMIGVGTPLASVTDDIDGDGRPGNLATEIGADEIADTNAPDTLILMTPTNPTASTAATFTFSGSDTRPAPEVVASFECKLDAEAFAACVSPVNLTMLADGSHTFMVRAKDANNNVDPTPASFTWLVDTTAPQTTIDTDPGTPTGDNTPTFTFAGDDGAGVGGLTFQCQLDGGGFSSCTSPFTTSALSDGSHTFQVRATDSLANTDATPASFTFVVDATAPQTTIDTNPPDPSNSANATFTFSGNDGAGVGGLTFECKLDAAAFAPCTSPQNLMGLSAGSHTFQVRATDSVLNTDASPASYTWVVNLGPAGPVRVTATAGTVGPTDYTTLKLAFDAINAGTHQGAITVDIYSDTTEGATPATLNSTGAGAAVYTSVNIRPANDGVTVTGNPGQGFGVIQLNGVDNVTVDGDNPNTAGTNRNLTVTNTTTTTLIAASAVRIATSATAPYDSNANNTIKNLILNGNVLNGNASGITLSTGSSNSSFGIIVGPNGGASVTAITSVTGAVPAGASVNNLVIDNNAVNQCARGIAFIGTNAASSTGIAITNNTIGATATLTGTAPFAAPATTVYTKGIYVQGTTAYTITGNTVQNILSFVATTVNGIEIVSGIGAGTQTISNNTINGVAQNSTATNVPRGILVSNAGAPYTISGNTVNNIQGVLSGIASGTVVVGIDVATSATAGTISYNKVSKVYNNNPGTTAARGINLGGGNNVTVANNFVSDVNGNGTGGFSFDGSFSTLGIRVGSGTGHKIYNNTVHMSGAVLGTPSSNLLTAAFGIASTALTGLDVRSNIFSNTLTGGTTSAHVSMFLPTNTTSAMNLTLNNNDYNSGPSATTQGIAQGGTTVGTGLYLASNFNAASTTPATNLRALTTLLGPATNDDSSKAVDPLFFSNTDLHITGASPVIDMGVNPGALTTDIDGQARVNGATIDIGADEFFPSPGALQLSSATYSGNEGTTVPVTVTRSGGATGAVGATLTFTDGSAIGGAACGAGVDYVNPGPQAVSLGDGVTSQVFNIQLCTDGALNDPNETFTATLSNATGGATLGSPLVATVTIVDVAPPFSGSFDVGTGQTYTSLTNPGGIFEAINLSGATGNVVINITSDLTGESGSVPLNQVAGGFTVTIKPSGAPRSITSTASAIALIKLNDADNVTIDGSTSGGTDRSLSLINSNTAANTAVIWVASLSNGAQNNTIKNVNLEGGANQSVANVFNFAIISSSSASLLTGGTDNDNNTYSNNFIKKVSVGIISIGGTAGNMNQNTVISGNLIGPAAFGIDEVSTLGILIFNENAPQIVDNELRFIGDAATAGGSSGRDHVGISLCTGSASWSGTSAPTVVGTVTNGVIARNRIHDVVDRATFSAVGIVENCTNAGNPTNNSIVNNFIYNIQSNGTVPDQGVGIGLTNSNTDTVAFNSVYLSGDIDPGVATSSDTSSFGISVALVSNTNLNLKNNISVMNITSNTGTLQHAAINIPSAFVWGTGGSNNNDWYPTAGNTQARVGAVGGSTGTFHATLAAWQGATSQDAASLSVDPLFVSATDLHIQAASTVQSAAAAGTGITNDIDNETRDAVPDMGADEIVAGTPGTLQFSSATYTVTEAGPVATITVTRTGGSNGVVGATYATVAGGTATGGAACGAGIDYVDTTGTVSFGNGVTTPQTFDIPMCDDAPDKVDETVNLALTLPTGGATLGAQNTAVLTITDNDTAPTISIDDVTLAEGNAGPTMFTFNVNLSAASGQTVTVHYQTADGTATLGDNDYNVVGDTILTFNPGQTTLPVTVIVNGDTNVEPDETFFVNLSMPTNATISDAQGQGTITNDDVVLPGVSISDARVTEGNEGNVNMTFTVTLNGGGAASVRYHTTNGTAQADVLPPAPGAELVPHGSDYVPEQNGIISFGANPNPEGISQTRTFSITVHGDTFKEPNEYFTVTLDQPIGAKITRAVGNGVIVDEDRAYIGDLDNDKKTDFTVFRPSDANWYTIQSSNNNPVYLAFGIPTDKPVPGDYDGDGKQDYAVRRPGATNEWWYQHSSDFSLHLAGWGVDSDLSVQADYDGDDKTDVAVFRNGAWYIYQSSDLQQRTVFFGQAGDVPVTGDFDGDGTADFTVFRNGTWYTLRSSDNTSTAQVWGQSGDKPVAGDFDGDGRFDLAVFRSGTWHILNSLLGTYTAVNFGLASDLTIPGDYDGDGTTDIAVFRPSAGDWYAIRSSNNSLLSFHWGLNGDIPIPSAYQP